MCGFLTMDSREYPLEQFKQAVHMVDDRGPDMIRLCAFIHHGFIRKRNAALQL